MLARRDWRAHIRRMAELLFAALPERALVRVAGPDARPFLHNLLTQDVEGLQAGELRYGALLTPQGRLQHELFLLGETDGVVLDVLVAERDVLIQRLTMFKLRAKVAVEPWDAPAAAAWGGAAAPSGGAWAGDPRLPELGWRGYGAEVPAGAAAEYDAHRLACGVADAARDFGEGATYPIEVNFDLLGGIDFRKGCFIGQETTSRMKRRGTIKTRLCPIAFDGPPPAPGAEVLSGALRAGEARSGMAGRGLARMRLDRSAAGGLTVSGRPVRLDPPAWLEPALQAPELSETVAV